MSLVFCASAAAQPVRPQVRPPVSQERVDQLLAAMNDPRNLDRKSAGERVIELPPSAKPALLKALDRKDLPWFAVVAARKAIENMEASEDPRRFSRRVRRNMDWYTRHMVEGYKAKGHRDAAWDNVVIEGLDMQARVWAGVNIGSSDAKLTTYLLRRAFNAGCRDPLVMYCLLRRYAVESIVSAADRQALYEQAIAGLQKHPYHVLFQITIVSEGLKFQLDQDRKLTDPAARIRQQKINERLLEKLPELLDDDQAPGRDAAIALANMVTNLKRITGDRMTALDQVWPVIEKRAKDQSTALTAKAEVLIMAAWDARGDGWGAEVPREAWQVFGERITLADAAVNEALRLNPHNEWALAKAITIAMARGDPREQMEALFRRAVALNPDYNDAYDAKLRYLMPRWHGGREELLEYGRQCLMTGNWQGQVALIVLNSHDDLSLYTRDGRMLPKPDPDYYERLGAWEDVVAACNGLRTQYIGDGYIGQRFMRAAVSAKQWKVAAELLDQHGAAADWRVFTSKQDWDQTKLLIKKMSQP